jgi:hypothetical protein
MDPKLILRRPGYLRRFHGSILWSLWGAAEKAVRELRIDIPSHSVLRRLWRQVVRNSHLRDLWIVAAGTGHGHRHESELLHQRPPEAPTRQDAGASAGRATERR